MPLVPLLVRGPVSPGKASSEWLDGLSYPPWATGVQVDIRDVPVGPCLSVGADFWRTRMWVPVAGPLPSFLLPSEPDPRLGVTAKAALSQSVLSPPATTTLPH